MVANKHISKIIIALAVVAVVLCLLAAGFSGKLSEYFGGTGVTMEYETKLFDTDEVISIDIQMDEEDWNAMLENAMSEEYYACDVVINGQKFSNVGIRPKGNTSLSNIVMDPDTDRYSLKLEFDQFVDGQTCYGLDKLILNNNYADATNMKEAIVYDMYQYLGVDASLYNYAEVSLNGEYWGVYLALEGVEESFMLRNYGTQDGELYKPDSMEIGGGDSKGSSQDSGAPSGFPGGGMTPPSGGMTPPSGFPGQSDSSGSDGSSEGDAATPPSGFPGQSDSSDSSESSGTTPPSGFDPSNLPEDFDPSNLPEGFDTSNLPEGFDTSDLPDMGNPTSPGNGGSPMGGNGANLNYTDDELDSYSTIWEGEITGTSTGDHRRVVTALKNISEGTDLETYLDVDNILKYMAVHAFAVNMDSLSGNMAHNYYLYEYDGQLNLLPWDYNLSFGGMSMGNTDATSMVNDAIDTPFSGTDFFDKLLENEEYLAKYHEYLQKLVDEYVNGGQFEETYNRIRSQIDSLVETDPTAFYNADEYEEAVQMLYEVVGLRAESIEGQLNGTIPSTDEGQKEDPSALIDASGIALSVMGSFGSGGGSGGDGSDSDNSRSGIKPPKSFSGMPSRTVGSSDLKTLGIYGICLAVMIVALLLARLYKRKKH